MMLAAIEDVKQVMTFDLSGKENGILTELFKDGKKTVAYMTTVKPGMLKGFHFHHMLSAQYVCARGKLKVVLYRDRKKEEYILDAKKPQRISIPAKTGIGLLNIGDEDAWLINYPNPAYDPEIKGEQVEYTEEELKKGVVK